MDEHTAYPIICLCGWHTTTNGPRICPFCGRSVYIAFEDIQEEDDSNPSENDRNE